MIEVIEGNTVQIDIKPYLKNRGWIVINKDRAEHREPYKGSIEFKKYNLIGGEEYDISYTLSNIGVGEVKLIVSGEVVDINTSSGYYQTTITPVSDGYIEVYSDTNVVLTLFSIKKKLTSKKNSGKDTVVYSNARKGWVSFRSYLPEAGASMNTDLITFKNGDLWIHDKESKPNNFYGEQYNSTVKFPVSSVNVKTYNSIAVHSNKVIGTTENGIKSELGDVTDLITYDFTTRNGVHYANLLRDKLTNNLIQGRYIMVELTDEETKGTKLEIFKIVLKSTINTLNE